MNLQSDLQNERLNVQTIDIMPNLFERVKSDIQSGLMNFKSNDTNPNAISPKAREFLLMRMCGTAVVMTTLLIFVLYQVIIGHQYFTARQFMIDLEKRLNTVTKEEREKKALEKELKNMMDLDYLVTNLEKVEKKLQDQIEDKEDRKMLHSIN